MEQLSKSEKQIMDTFWNSPQPLPASDLLSACVGRTWKARSVFPLVKKLIEKGALAEVGCVRRGKTYARTFQPAFSRVEYWAEIIKQEDMDGDQLSELTDLLAQHKRSLDLAWDTIAQYLTDEEIQQICKGYINEFGAQEFVVSVFYG